MPWTVELAEPAAEEYDALAPDQRAHFQRIAGLIREHGLERIHFPLVRHVEGPLWEIRLKGRSGIARALYVTRIGQRVAVVRIFVKKRRKPRDVKSKRLCKEQRRLHDQDHQGERSSQEGLRK